MKILTWKKETKRLEMTFI